VFDDRIYVFTPQATIIELPAGATPVDFAYTLHTDLGHRCRGARVDGAMVPLNTPLANGQTVESWPPRRAGRRWTGSTPNWATCRARARGPRCGPGSTRRRWRHHRARPRAGGKAAAARRPHRLKLDDLAAQLGFKGADALFEVVGKDEFSLRNIEPAAPGRAAAPRTRHRRCSSARAGPEGGVLVVGVELAADAAGALLPAGAARRHRRLRHARQGRGHPPARLQQLPPHGRALARAGHRRGLGRGAATSAVYPVDVVVEAADRPGLLRDISEVFAKDKAQRHRRAHPVGQGPGRRHRLHDLHRGGGRRHPAGPVLRAGGSGAGHPHARRR
jgi:GTP pyrophosphokinase